MLSGSIPALVTPFRGGTFDEAAFRALVDWQVESGSCALVPCGTTGESATLTEAEHHRIVEVCVAQAAGRVPVIAGCGGSDTQVVLQHMDGARRSGAAAALVVTPYYSRPSQDGLIAHFTHLARYGDLPIILYNVPARTGVDLQPATVCELVRRFPDTFIGIKDATGDLSRVTAHRMGIGSSFVQLAGDDRTAAAFNAAGGSGCISVTANVAPALCAQLQAACVANDFATARDLSSKLYPLHQALFADSSPSPCKYALSLLVNGFANELRLPLVPCHAEAERAVKAALVHAGLG